MAFDAGNLSIIVQPVSGGGLRFVSYRSDDSIATVSATDYFTAGESYGLRLGDLIFVSPVTGTTEPFILVVSTVDSDGNVTATQTAFDAELTALAGLDKSDGNIIVGNGTTWVAENGATARASLGLTIGTDVQAYDADLAAIAALAKTNGFVVEIFRVSSTGYIVTGLYYEEGGTTDIIPADLIAIGSGNFDVGIDVTLGHASDSVTPVSFVVEPI